MDSKPLRVPLEAARFNCPFCGQELQENNSVMWTGMRNQVLMYKLRCIQKDHSFEVKAATEEKLKEIIECGIKTRKTKEDTY